MTARRAALAAVLALPPAAGAHARPPEAAGDGPPIGTARMEPDGTILLDLAARGGGGPQGDARLRYPPGHPDHAAILRHLGGLRPGEVKPVPPFP